jgi:hypothetical protein
MITIVYVDNLIMTYTGNDEVKEEHYKTFKMTNWHYFIIVWGSSFGKKKTSSSFFKIMPKNF